MITNYAKYTVVLKSLLDNSEANAKIQKALSTYPLYAPSKVYDLIPTREELNNKLLNHYKYREIGFETVGRFIDELEITMKEIMPRYNELFKTVETMAELPSPFDNVDVTETYSETRTDNASSTGTTSSNASTETSGSDTNTKDHTRLFSDTPQNSIENINNYLTDHTKENTVDSGENESTSTSEGNETSTTSSEGTTTVEHTYSKSGNQGVNTYAHDMNEFRTSIIDVVDQIINDVRIAELFMLVY